MTSYALFAAAQVPGIPLPYSPRMDDGVTFVLLSCFFLSAYVLSHCRKFLYQLAKNFRFNRERASIFSTTTVVNGHHLLLLALQTCTLVGTCLFCYFSEAHPELLLHVRPLSLLGGFIGICVLYLLFKWGAYLFLGWIFLDKDKSMYWMESYSTLIYYLGFALFPFALLQVYFGLGLLPSVITGLFLLLFAKILMFFKWLKLFCGNLHGVFFLILYFCALEIMPCVALYHGMVVLNDLLTIKN